MNTEEHSDLSDDQNKNVNSGEDNSDGSLMAGGDPHQQEDLDQAVTASEASFTLEPEKGLTPEPDEYNKEEDQDSYNLKQE